MAPEVAEDVYRLTVYGTNVYLVRSGSSWALIDTGWAWGGCGRKIRAAAAALFGADARPAAILLTHVHPDHDGSALELARLWNRPVHVHPGELPMTTASLDAFERFGNAMDRRLLVPLLRAMPRARVQAMLDGTSLRDVVQPLDPTAPIPGLPDWTPIHTPGHSPGHVALFRQRDRVLLSGDAALTVDGRSPLGLLGLTLRRQRRVFAPPGYTNWDQRATEASIAVLAKLEPLVVAPSHGDAMEGEPAARALRGLAEKLAASATK